MHARIEDANPFFLLSCMPMCESWRMHAMAHRYVSFGQINASFLHNAPLLRVVMFAATPRADGLLKTDTVVPRSNHNGTQINLRRFASDSPIASINCCRSVEAIHACCAIFRPSSVCCSMYCAMNEVRAA